MRTLLATGALLVLASAIPGRARAEDGCANPKTTYDKTYCVAKLFLESDKELNQVYKDLKKAIPKPVQVKLTDVQKEWISYRDTTCESNGTINVQCNFDVNKTRTEYLRDRLRECKTGHCQEEQIGKKSW
jgi:uncharacterized protein YecT (DUF1311 family)